MFDFFTNNKEFFLTLLKFNSFIVVWIIIVYLFNTNRKNMIKRGFEEEYILAMKSIQKNQLLNFVFIFFAAQFVVGWTLHLFSLDITEPRFRQYLFFGSHIIAVTYLLYNINNVNKKYRELAIKTNSDIVIDFNYKNLKYVFHVRMEIAASIIILYFGVGLFQWSPGVTFLGIAPWMTYFILRKTKNHTKALYRDTYLKLAKINIFFQVFYIYFLIILSIRFEETLSWLDFALYISLCGLMLARLIYYTYCYPKLKKEVDLSPDKSIETSLAQ